MLNWYRALRLKRRSELGPIRSPTLILWGKKDPALSTDLATESLKLGENGRIGWLTKGNTLVASRGTGTGERCP